MNRLNRGYEVPEELRGLHRDELLEALRARPEPFFVKTHRREHAADPAPALYLVRDGRDVHVSQAHWRADKDPAASFAECLDELVSRPIWSRHVRDWRTRAAPTAVIRFEELLADPAATMKRGCDELGVTLPASSGELQPFSALNNRNPVVFRKGEAGAWKEEMPRRTEQRFWRLHEDEMLALGYSR